MGILEYGAKFCAKKLDEMDRTQRYPIAVPSPEIVLHTDLPYCSGGDPAHRLDLCYPAKGGDFPLVIDIHGGGLIYGTKALNRDLRFTWQSRALRWPALITGWCRKLVSMDKFGIYLLAFVG